MGESYTEKRAYLETYFEEVAPTDFYREIFPVGSFEQDQSFEGKPNGIVAFSYNDKIRTNLFFDDHKRLFETVETAKFSFLAPISYFGKNRTSKNARYIYALAFDLDGVGEKQINNLFFQIEKEVQPKPTFTVNSGNGLHLYYQFEKPIPLYPHVQENLNSFKKELTNLIWNPYTSTFKKRQIQSISQGFRVVGTPTKFGADYITKAYRTGEKVSLKYLNNWVNDETKRIDDITYKTDLPISEAKVKYPEWYESKIVKKEKKKTWVVKQDLYFWWLNKIKEGASFGHRYWCIWCLGVYAKKCNISKKQLHEDAFNLLIPFSNLDKDNPFTEDDIKSALKVYDKPYETVSRQFIVDKSAIMIQPNKRNKRKQTLHLKMARSNLDIMNEDNGYCLQGRPDKKDIVLEFRKQYPNSTKAECIRQTRLDRKTVAKWWDC